MKMVGRSFVEITRRAERQCSLSVSRWRCYLCSKRPLYYPGNFEENAVPHYRYVWVHPVCVLHEIDYEEDVRGSAENQVTQAPTDDNMYPSLLDSRSPG
jgi:hypothetical protein